MIDVPGRLWRRLRVLWNWRRHNAELLEEMNDHLERRRRDFEARGMSPVDAEAAAHRAMGAVTAVRESSRSVWLASWLESIWQDLAYGFRSIRRQPAFAAVAILGLSGGLGFAAAAFTGVNGLMLRGWNVPAPDRLIALFATSVGEPGNRRDSGFSLDQVQLFATQARSLDGVLTHERTRADGTGSVTAAPVSANYFDVLDVPLFRGRAFTPDEDRIGARQQVIIVSHRYWRTALSSASDVLGQSVRVQGVPFTVVGVAAEGFEGTDLIGVEAWIPMASMPIVRPRDNRSTGALAHSDQCCVNVAARMAPGVTREQVDAELTALLARHMRPGIDTLKRQVTTQAFTMVGSSGPNVEREVVPVFLLIGGGVGVVLLLACANVANLLLARAATRQREITIRLALGASRGRVVRQLMTESLLLALLAGIPALLIARWVPGWVLQTMTEQQIAVSFSTDGNVLVFTGLLALGSCLVFGLAPAFHATRPLVAQRRRLPLRSVFLSAQVTFSLVLLVSAGLFVRSANMERSLHLGFATDDVTEVRISIPANEDAAVRGRRLSADVMNLVAANRLPRVAYGQFAPFNPEGVRYSVPGASAIDVAPVMYASPSYFDVLSLQLATGRVYRDDIGEDANEIVINTALAERYGGASKALGAAVLIDSVPFTVVGVVQPTRDVGFREVRPSVYLPFRWEASPRVIIRGDENGARRLAVALRELDPSLTVTITPYSRYVAERFSTTTFAASIAGALGALALVLASIGMFGVFSYWVEQRQHDIGVRFALGATREHVVKLVLGASARAVGWGLGIGILAAVGASQLLRSSLYGLQPLDPPAFAAAIGVLIVSALVATLIPTWRAVKIDPIESLRAD